MAELVSDRRFLIAVTLVMTALTFWRMVSFADHSGFFIDESLHDTYAAANFFRHLDYAGFLFSEPFDPRISVGIAATWLSGLSAVMGNTLFVHRLLLIVVEWGSFVFSVSILLRRFGLPALAAVAAAATLWVLLLRDVPIALGFVLNLGELPAALYLLWGLVSLPRRPVLGFVLFGVGVWLAKVLFLPVAFALGLAYWLSTAKAERAEARRATKLVFAFLAPELAWLLLIGLRCGGGLLLSWLATYTHFLWFGSHETVLGIHGDGHVSVHSGLLERLADPKLEWAGFGAGVRARLVLFAVAPVVVAPYLWIRGERAERIHALVLPAISLFYAYWWFWHDTGLFLRHAQAQCILALGFLAYCLIRFGRDVSAKSPMLARATILALLVAICLREGVNLRHEAWPIMESGTSYARGCRGDTANTGCAPEYYFK